MARIDYFEIGQQIKQVLIDDPDLDGVTVLVEEQPVFGEGDVIVIWPARRIAPPGQSLSAGTRVTYDIDYAIWCYGQALDASEASRMRDNLVGRAEIALMRNRTLNGAAKHITLRGGEFGARDEPVFVRGAEIGLGVDKTAIA